MHGLFFLALLLPPPDLESSFEGTVLDSNGDVVWLKVETRSTFKDGRIVRRMEVISETEGLSVRWVHGGGSFSGPLLNFCGSGFPAKKCAVKDGFITVSRGDTLLFRMYAPVYEREE